MGRQKSDTTINAGTVQYVAYLVRLGITEAEAAAFAPQLNAIIDYFHLLNEVNTDTTPPATEIPPTRNVLRSDEVAPSMPREAFLKNVPQQEGAFVKVPLVFDEE